MPWQPLSAAAAAAAAAARILPTAPALGAPALPLAQLAPSGDLCSGFWGRWEEGKPLKHFVRTASFRWVAALPCSAVHAPVPNSWAGRLGACARALGAAPAQPSACLAVLSIICSWLQHTASTYTSYTPHRNCPHARRCPQGPGALGQPSQLHRVRHPASCQADRVGGAAGQRQLLPGWAVARTQHARAGGRRRQQRRHRCCAHERGRGGSRCGCCSSGTGGSCGCIRG